jgi:GAF domain-containing protein
MVLATLTIIAFGWVYSAGQLPVSPDPRALATDMTWWLNVVMVYVLLATMMVISQNYLVPRLVAALSRSRRLTQELQSERAGLEERVQERTSDLARRNTQLEAAAQVAREAAAIHDLGALLGETVRLISDRFGFYHAGIFLLDASGEWAVLQAASSEGGQRMLSRGHRLKVGEVGIVGYVTGWGEPRVALDVGTDAVFFNNPDLPETRSEMALPLRVRGEITGALDVQSTQQAAFNEESIAVLQILADQLALAISNARLFQQAQGALEAERRAYGELSRQAWIGLLQAQPDLGERYDPQGILPADGQWRKEMELAAHKEETVVAGEYTRRQNGLTVALATPIKVRDLVIGVLDAHKSVNAGEASWTAEEITLIETLADQLGVALENARLYRDTQRRAIRERLTGQVTTRMRETLDVDAVLQTAVREIGEALGLHDVTVRFNLDTDQAG